MARLTRADEDRAIQMVLQQGLSYREVAKQLGTTTDKTVRATVERYQQEGKRRWARRGWTPQDRLLTLTDRELQKVRKRLELDEQEVLIWEQRLASRKARTLQELADELQLSRQRVHQIEAKMIERLADAV